MASAAFLLLCTHFLLICAFLGVNKNTVYERHFQEDYSMLDFTHGIQSFESMFLSTLEAVQWSHIFLLIKVVSCVFFLVYQLWSMISNERELDGLDKHNESVAYEVKGVSQFYKGIENQFQNLTSKSSNIKEWFSNIESTSTTANISMKEEMNKEIESLQKSFHRQQSIFLKYGIDINAKLITEENFKAQLTMAQAFVERTVRKLEADTKEDHMTVADVKKHIRSLKAYFGQKSK